MRIALYEPDIPQNTGNIFRLGACFGIPVDIIEPTGYIFNNKKFKRSAMDYIKEVKYKRHDDWNSFFDWTKINKFRLILLTTKAKKNYYNYNFKKNDILIFGRESAGVPSKIHELVDIRLKIPMKKNLRSLNVSSAAAIAVSEACKQLKILKF
ncbi:MAG: tRNA (cytidine(34)-2'-O)-methyltransferase [Alphaproteobacteria bacterium MarineAlpha5_Bin9]|nr:MAG: tRNA (cytidine(34)-2'-O)-methyltransferase [Alphaproteobacteria bacterium MarineAlpha5_Bin9]|tara:strand:- start:2190 stop:2648 length:459 start_codon:yes stop_codon:yes gene_type:complete